MCPRIATRQPTTLWLHHVAHHPSNDLHIGNRLYVSVYQSRLPYRSPSSLRNDLHQHVEIHRNLRYIMSKKARAEHLKLTTRAAVLPLAIEISTVAPNLLALAMLLPPLYDMIDMIRRSTAQHTRASKQYSPSIDRCM